MAGEILINEKRDIRYYLDDFSIRELHRQAMRSRLSASAFLRVLARVLKEERYAEDLQQRVDKIILEESHRGKD